jgi:DNA-directed RNA polymerase subunit beta'
MVDRLRGLKENVIMGRLIPAGTGARRYQRFDLNTKMPESRPEPSMVVAEEKSVPAPEGETAAKAKADAAGRRKESEEVGVSEK